MDDFYGYLELITQIIDSARTVWESGKYPSNVKKDGFVTPRMEALTFFHGQWFEDMMDMLDQEPVIYLMKNGIPVPSTKCSCESCRSNYRAEAKMLQEDEDLVYKIRGKAKLAYQFAPEEKHIVYWEEDKIKFVIPQESVSILKASKYLEKEVLH